MKKTSQLLAPLKIWFFSLGKRERLLVGTAAILVPVYLLATLTIIPALDKYRLLHKQVHTQQNNNIALEQQLVDLKRSLAQSPSSRQQQEIARLQQEVHELYTGIDIHLDSLIAPEQMPAVLRRLLHHHPGLTLHNIKNTPPQRILPFGSEATPAPKDAHATPDADATTDDRGGIKHLYRQSFVLQIEGPYLDALSYLEKIRTWPERMFVDSVSITMEEYPNNMITLQISSISTAPSLLRGSAPGEQR